MSSALQAAIEAHQAGHLDDAEARYRKILEHEPEQPDALHYLGVLIFHRRQAQEGIGMVRRALAVDGSNPHAWNNLGNMLLVAKDLDGAQAAYERALCINREMHQAWYNLGVVFRRRQKSDECIACFAQAVSLRPEYDMAYESLGMMFYRIGAIEKAHKAYCNWLEVSPKHPVARHMAAATAAGGPTPARADDDYVRTLFDNFASTFDHSLERLHYRAPELIVSALQDQAEYQSGRAVILDAGCGTGLCGVLLRSSARRLFGIDLSPQMVERARARGCYDEVAVGELTAFMRDVRLAFDVIASADTLVYFGALDDVAEAAFGSLKADGILIFTVEAWDTADPAASYEILPNGRYRHARAYVERALRAAGFESIQVRGETLRHELGEEVAGWLTSARKPALQSPPPAAEGSGAVG